MRINKFDMKPFILTTLFSLLFLSCTQQHPADTNTEKKSDPEALPVFRYNPDALALGIIKKQQTNCPSCGKIRAYVYDGPFYTTQNIEGLCPWCIKDGSAAKKYHGEFQDSASCEEVKNGAALEELLHHTPGYSGWQQEIWLSHCGDFCAFKGFVDWAQIKDFENELSADLDSFCKDYSMSRQEFKQALTDNAGFQAYLFQCLKCKKHRLTADCD
jgi:uncharacterized protein